MPRRQALQGECESASQVAAQAERFGGVGCRRIDSDRPVRHHFTGPASQDLFARILRGIAQTRGEIPRGRYAACRIIAADGLHEGVCEFRTSIADRIVKDRASAPFADQRRVACQQDLQGAAVAAAGGGDEGLVRHSGRGYRIHTFSFPRPLLFLRIFTLADAVV